MKSGDFVSAAGSFWIWIVLTVTAVCHLPGVNALECHPNSKGPCSCGPVGGLSVDCEGDGPTPLTQADVNDFFTKLRLHNNLTATDTLELFVFSLYNSDLTNFDLTPLFWTKMQLFDIQYNSKLTGFSGGDTGTGTIEPSQVRLNSNALTTEGLDGFFKLFNGLRLHEIELNYNKLTGVPDLSTLRSLQSLSFYSNKISELKAGSFRSLTNLRQLKLSVNPVDFVRESAFLMDPPNKNDSSRYTDLFIGLDYTNLKSAGFSPMSGIDKIKKDVILSIRPQFDSLPQDVFLPFLEANPNNLVYLNGNKEFQCDSRVKWLQDREKEFKDRVIGAECSNDPGRTIWTSEKVKSGSNWSVGPPGPGILISLGLVLIYTMYFSSKN